MDFKLVAACRGGGEDEKEKDNGKGEQGKGEVGVGGMCWKGWGEGKGGEEGKGDRCRFHSSYLYCYYYQQFYIANIYLV